MENDIGSRKSSSRPKELQKSCMKFDEEAVQNCCNIIKQRQPIVSSSDAIVSLSSGVNASKEVQRDLLKAESVGKTKVRRIHQQSNQEK